LNIFHAPTLLALMEIRNDSELGGFIDGLHDDCKNMVKVFTEDLALSHLSFKIGS